MIDRQTTLLRDTREMWLLSVPVHMCVFVCLSACVPVSKQHANKYLCLLLPSGGFDPVPSGSSWGCGPSSSSSDDCSAPVPFPLRPSTPPLTPLPPHSVSLLHIVYYLRAFLPSHALCAALHTHRVHILLSNGDGLRKRTGHEFTTHKTVTFGYFA